MRLINTKGEDMARDKQEEFGIETLKKTLEIRKAERKTLENKLKELRDTEKVVYDKLQATGGAIQTLEEVIQQMPTGGKQ